VRTADVLGGDGDLNRTRRPQHVTQLTFLGLLATMLSSARAADAPGFEQAAAGYTTAARPLLAKYCLECHSTELMEGDLDLERFASLSDVRKSTRVWLKVAEMLDNGEMPRGTHGACPSETARHFASG